MQTSRNSHSCCLALVGLYRLEHASSAAVKNATADDDGLRHATHLQRDRAKIAEAEVPIHPAESTQKLTSVMKIALEH